MTIYRFKTGMPWRVAYDPADAAQKHTMAPERFPEGALQKRIDGQNSDLQRRIPLSKVKKSFSEWGDDLCVMVLYNDPRADRLQRRLGQLQRVEDWLQRLSGPAKSSKAGRARSAIWICRSPTSRRIVNAPPRCFESSRRRSQTLPGTLARRSCAYG